ncbi:MAG: helix-turn-helix domain-containing protein [Bacteroidota bacterium]
MTVVKLHLEEKMSVPEISQITETKEETILNWLEAFEKGGFLALLNSWRPLDKESLPLELKNLHFFYSLLPPQT